MELILTHCELHQLLHVAVMQCCHLHVFMYVYSLR